MDIQLIAKKIARRLKVKKKILLNERPGSYPYISGDTFRSICDIIIESENDFYLFLNIIKNKQRITKIFVSLSFIEKYENYFLKMVTQIDYSFKDISIIFHNGDKIPCLNFFLELSKIFKKIYCVNFMHNINNVIPVPIGLENYHLFKNGKIEDIIQFNNLIRSNVKDVSIFSCFDTSTNYLFRKPVKDLLFKSRFTNIFNSLENIRYINYLKRSLFIISPPGNGYDCHRNWEAIYYKCIPVVLNNYLPKHFIDNLPIFAVNSYDEILNKSDSELIFLYNEIIKNRSADISYFDYWINLINSNE